MLWLHIRVISSEINGAANLRSELTDHVETCCFININIGEELENFFLLNWRDYKFCVL